ncbi:MAG: hypothetical protein FJZ96_15130 [Chloroflexi bacterium]|nr:hypothetical protein [Chloroflexota bacterium]
MSKINHLQFFLLLILLFVMGCRGYQGDEPQMVEEATSTPFAILPPTFTPTSVVTPFPYPLSTLPASEIQSLVLELLSTNDGCLLPCWWGITPGFSKWLNVRSIIEPLASDVDYVEAVVPDRFVVYISIFELPDSITRSYIDIRIVVDQGTVVKISVHGFEGSPTWRLPAMLEDYGPPDEVWLHTYRSYRDINPPMDVLLFYQNRGILARYPSSEEEILDNSIIQVLYRTNSG